MAANRISRRNLLSGLAGLVVGGLLSGCGFKLRGTGLTQAAYQSVYLRFDSSMPIELQQAITQRFQQAGVQVLETSATAELVIEFGSFKRDISRTSRSATGQTTAELIRLTQAFKAYRMQDEQLILDTQTVVMRDRQLDPSQLLAAERELNTIIQAMLQTLSGQVFDRVNRTHTRGQP